MVSEFQMLDVQRLNVYFGHGQHRNHALRDVSFAVPKGACFGLVGESGSGKSTVLRAICGLLKGWDGTLRLAGTALTGSRNLAFRRRVQMVFQDPYGSLHPRHTIDKIVAEPLHIHRFDSIKSRTAQALKEVGLDLTFRFRYPHQLSGGQRQRVAVARVLAMEPEVVLLDEPTSALDVSVQAEVLNLLARLRRERDLTYLLVSHDLAVIGHLCDELAVMQKGRIVEKLNVDQLHERQPCHAYTQQLLQASRGYDRKTIDGFEDFA